ARRAPPSHGGPVSGGDSRADWHRPSPAQKIEFSGPLSGDSPALARFSRVPASQRAQLAPCRDRGGAHLFFLAPPEFSECGVDTSIRSRKRAARRRPPLRRISGDCPGFSGILGLFACVLFFESTSTRARRPPTAAEHGPGACLWTQI